MCAIKFTDEQSEIMKYKGSTMAVSAVPGAGKTFITTHLLVKLIGDNPDKRILVLTYMNSAVNNFKRRINALIEESGLSGSLKRKFDIMTIHSLAVSIIKEDPESVNIDRDFEIIDELRKTALIDSLIEDFMEQYTNGKKNRRIIDAMKDSTAGTDPYIKKGMDSTINNLVRLVITELKYRRDYIPEMIKKGLLNKESLNKGMVEFFYPIYWQYTEYLDSNGLLDYDDLLIYALKLLKENPTALKRLQERYHFICEDECQDSNFIQGEIITLLRKGHNNLIRVGDINQSITGTFSKSDPQGFKDFIDSADYNYIMSYSGRSSRSIIAAANSLVDYMKDGLRLETARDALAPNYIRAFEPGKGVLNNPETVPNSVFLHTAADQYDEREYIVKLIKRYIEMTSEAYKGTRGSYEGTSGAYKDTKEAKEDTNSKDIESTNKAQDSKGKKSGSIAVLCRSNYEVSALSQRLNDAGIEHETPGNLSEEKKVAITRLALLTKMILNPSDEKTKNEVEEFSSVDINTLCGLNTLGLEGLIISLIPFLGELGKEDHGIILYIAKYLGYRQKFEDNFGLRDAYNILNSKLSNPFYRICEFYYEMNGYEPENGSVTICTYHKAKGLEWDMVVMSSTTSDNFPTSLEDSFKGEKSYLQERFAVPELMIENDIYNIDKTLGIRIGYGGALKVEEYKLRQIKEAIRLYYVGVTRAKERLVITAAKVKDSTKHSRSNNLRACELNGCIANASKGKS